MILDMRRPLLRDGIIPRRILHGVPIDRDIIVRSLALPRAGRMSVRRRENRLVDGRWWEVNVALDGLVVIGAGDHFAVDLCCGGRHFGL